MSSRVAESIRLSLFFAISSLALWFSLALSLAAQDLTSKDVGATLEKGETAAAKVKAAASTGFKLSASTSVSDVVSVDAVMLPASISKKVFGKEVGNNYAVIELIVSNRSADASLIVHSIFIDFSQWLLSGASPYESNLLCSVSDLASAAQTDGNKPPTVRMSGKDNSPDLASPKKCGTRGNTLPLWQSQTQPNQIASVETRIVRGQLLDSQPWTTRNWIIRALQLTGSVASSLTFATASQSWIRGIGAFNGQGVPGTQTFWPDATVGQMNRISDLGFQVNKVIAKQSADIIVAFFPIDRFVSPGLKSLFLSSPAVFFAPYVMIHDPTVKDRLSKFIDPLISSDDQLKLNAHLSEVTTGQCTSSGKPPEGSDLEKACQTADLLNHLSLNTVRVLVGGALTVDVDTVPSNIISVEVDPAKDETSATMWSKTGDLTGIIRGSFLSNGTPVIIDSDQLGIKIAAETAGSTDTQLNFKITLQKALPTTQTKLTFQVKKTKGGTSVQSATYDYPVSVGSVPTDENSTSQHQAAGATRTDQGPPGKPSESQPKDKNNNQH